MNDREIEIAVIDNTNPSMPTMRHSRMPAPKGMLNPQRFALQAFRRQIQNRKMTVGDAYKVLMEEECDKLLDNDTIIQEAIRTVENDGIVFIDEIDKIAGKDDRRGSDVSREGVQRDLLPLIEGTTVTTKYGMVKTDHILFICSGAFHLSKPSDLLPELQGRLPIRVELKALNHEDFVRILTERKQI